MVGYSERRVRRQGTVVTYIFKVIRGKIHNVDILRGVELVVLDGYVGRRRQWRLVAGLRANQLAA